MNNPLLFKAFNNSRRLVLGLRSRNLKIIPRYTLSNPGKTNLTSQKIEFARHKWNLILFSAKVNCESDGDLYSACSNPTIVESHAALLSGGLIGW